MQVCARLHQVRSLVEQAANAAGICQTRPWLGCHSSTGWLPYLVAGPGEALDKVLEPGPVVPAGRVRTRSCSVVVLGTPQRFRTSS